MEVKPGYKQTEVGVVPEGWGESRIGNFATVEGGFAFSSKKFLASGKYQVVKMSNLYGGVLDLERSGSYLNALSAQEKHYLLIQGDILITLTGTVGKRDYGYSRRISSEQNLLLNQRVARLVVKEPADSRYVAFQIQMPCFLNQFFDLSKGGTGNQANVGTRDIEDICIPLPPAYEQRAIAAALSDVGALLGGLDRLITKKRDLKLAAMQQLLTGQTRLPGFLGKWEVKRLGEVGEITGAGVDKKIHPNEMPVRLLNYLDVYKKDFLRSDDFWHEVSARPDQARRCAVQRGDVFFTPTSEVRDDIGHSAVATENIPDVVYSYHVVRLRLFENWDVRFRTYVFKTKEFMDQASTQCEGSGTRYVITLPKFRAMTVRFPVDVKEQAAIGSFLSDMDAELTALEVRRDKTRALKQAMMQELLTGKTRLVPIGDTACLNSPVPNAARKTA